LTDKKSACFQPGPLYFVVGTWNEYLPPLVMINNEALYPWPSGISMQYQGQHEPISAGAGLREPANGSGQFLPYDLETYHCRPHFVRGKRVKYSSDNGI
jgi:hypothetical protein